MHYRKFRLGVSLSMWTGLDLQRVLEHGDCLTLASVAWVSQVTAQECIDTLRASTSQCLYANGL